VLEPTTGWEYRAERTMIKTGRDSRKYQKEDKGNKVLATTQTGHHGERKQSKRCNSNDEGFWGIRARACARESTRLAGSGSPAKASRTPSDYNPYALPHRRNAIATTETTYNNATSIRIRRPTNSCKPTALKGIQSNFLHRHKCKGLVLPVAVSSIRSTTDGRSRFKALKQTSKRMLVTGPSSTSE
jgi:hypothetical protein